MKYGAKPAAVGTRKIWIPWRRWGCGVETGIGRAIVTDLKNVDLK
jgi:hypothetical protein